MRRRYFPLAHLPLLLSLSVLASCAVRSGEWYDTQKGAKPNFFERLAARSSAERSTQTAQPSKKGVVRVRRGDSYYTIAQRYRVSMPALMAANNAKPPFKLREGQEVRLPKPSSHTVRRGDTLYSLAQTYQVRLSELVQLNGNLDPKDLRVGMKLALPGSIAEARSSASSTASARNTSRPPAIRAAAPPRKGRFIQPVNGRVISNFGPKAGGLHNDGINIAAPAGTPVKAVENGVVVYAGNELRGYGNLVLVRHKDGWVSAYAHVQSFAVKPGQQVKQGDIVGRVGQSGNVDTPQLHFEIRRGTQAVDPRSVL